MSIIRRVYENGNITVCPLHRSRGSHLIERNHKTDGKKKKTFQLSPRRKRIIESSAIRQFYNKKYSIKFGTLTFSKTVNHKAANKCLSKFIDNLKKTYNVKSYIFVKELHKNGNPHYHFLLDMPFNNFRLLNSAWCSACSDIMPFSNNALTTGSRPIVQTIKDVIKYITKYIAKADDIKLSETRNYFIDQNTLSAGHVIDENEYIYLLTRFDNKIIIKDNFTMVYLKDFHYLPEKILPKFQRKVKKPPKIPDSFNANFDFYGEASIKVFSSYDREYIPRYK